jgi:hypothetical protein
MTVRSKFQLVEVTLYAWTMAKTLTFRTVYDPNIPEDVRFQKATPNGEFKQYVDNPAALAQFTLGEFYYFDATPVPAPVAITTTEQPA